MKLVPMIRNTGDGIAGRVRLPDGAWISPNPLSQIGVPEEFVKQMINRGYRLVPPDQLEDQAEISFFNSVSRFDDALLLAQEGEIVTKAGLLRKRITTGASELLKSFDAMTTMATSINSEIALVQARLTNIEKHFPTGTMQ